MKRTRRAAARVWSALLALTLAVTLLPTAALAAGEKDNGLKLDKKVDLQADGTYTIRLEAYATGEVKTVKKQVPTDVVLVLDVSGSMDTTITEATGNYLTDNSRTYEDVYDTMRNRNNQLYVRVDGEYFEVKVERTGRRKGGYRYTLEYIDENHVECLLGTASSPGNVDVVDTRVANSDGHVQFYYAEIKTQDRLEALQGAAEAFVDATALKNAEITDPKEQHKISIVKFAGDKDDTIGDDWYWFGEYNYTQIVKPLTTAVGDGAEELKTAINDLDHGGATSADYGFQHANTILQESAAGRAKVVVFITDGEPNHGRGFDTTVATDAINEAKTLKDMKAKVFSISVLTDADPDDTTEQMNQYMNAVSSNYPTAIATTDGGYSVTLGTGKNDGYYKKATNAKELASIFEEISDSVGSTDITLDEKAVLKDIISDKFQLPENYNADGKSVKVYTSDYTGNGNWAEPVEFAPVDENREPIEVVAINGKTIEVTGFSYKNNYVLDPSGTITAPQGKKLIVTIEGVEATGDAVTGNAVLTNDPDSGIYDGDTAAGKFPTPSVSIPQKNYVLDYGGKVVLNASDWKFDKIKWISLDMGKDGVNALTTDEYLGHGRASVDMSATAVTYQPDDTKWDGVDSFYVFGIKDSKPSWLRVNILPANNVYFEQNFGADDDTKQSSSGFPYGYDPSYANYNQATGSGEKEVKVGEKETFTFTGTGVDVYIRTSPDAGTVYAKLEGEGVTKIRIVDNLSVSGTYYQIPSVTFMDLTYGTYTVTLQPTKVSGTRTEYYLDGYRVYHPIQEEDAIVEEAYGADGELNSTFVTVRDILLNDGTATTLPGTETADGEIMSAVFIDHLNNSVSDVATYRDYGPKNEVYLAPGQSVVIDVASYGKFSAEATNFYLGLKAPNGATRATVFESDTNNAFVAATGGITASSDMYYEITTTMGYIVVTNSGDKLLSITKLRTAFKEASPYYDESTFAMFSMEDRTVMDAIDFLAYIMEHATTTTTIVPTNPDNIIEIEVPEEPVIPETPMEPIVPAEPVEPEVPVEPEAPAEPEVPVEPEIPVEPEVPVKPEKTEKPEKPEKPETPTEPEAPVTPETSAEDGSVTEQVPQEPEKTLNEIWAEQEKLMNAIKEGKNA